MNRYSWKSMSAVALVAVVLLAQGRTAWAAEQKSAAGASGAQAAAQQDVPAAKPQEDAAGKCCGGMSMAKSGEAAAAKSDDMKGMQMGDGDQGMKDCCCHGKK